MEKNEKWKCSKETEHKKGKTYREHYYRNKQKEKVGIIIIEKMKKSFEIILDDYGTRILKQLLLVAQRLIDYLATYHNIKRYYLETANSSPKPINLK